MYLVTGGADVNSRATATTEVMSALGSSWSYVGNLPRATQSMRGIYVNNQLFITGRK